MYNLYNTVLYEVKKTVATECGMDHVTRNTPLMNRNGPGYFDCMDVLYDLQRGFNVQLPESRYKQYETVGSLTRAIVNELSTKIEK